MSENKSERAFRVLSATLEEFGVAIRDGDQSLVFGRLFSSREEVLGFASRIRSQGYRIEPSHFLPHFREGRVVDITTLVSELAGNDDTPGYSDFTVNDDSPGHDDTHPYVTIRTK